MDEDEDTTSGDIKVYDGPPVQKEDTTVHDDMKKLQNDFTRVDVSALSSQSGRRFDRICHVEGNIET